jgi:hypothetical protein
MTPYHPYHQRFALALCLAAKKKRKKETGEAQSYGTGRPLSTGANAEYAERHVWR